MIKGRINYSKLLKVNNTTEGETIEMKVRRVTENNEPITDSAPEIFTEKKDGVLPGHDIRTDRFDVAIEAMDKVTGMKRAKKDQLGDTSKEGEGQKTEGTEGGANEGSKSE